MIIVSIDCEMAGLSPDCSIVSFGAVIDNLNVQESLHSLPRYHCYFLPEKDFYIGEPYALSMHKEIWLEIDQFKKTGKTPIGTPVFHPRSFGNHFKLWLCANGLKQEKDRVVINVAGKNFSGFDWPSLKKSTDFDKHIEVRHRVIDPAFSFLQEGDESLPNLSTCKSRAGIAGEVTHTALDDALDVIQLVRYSYNKMVNK